jgi:hypothetical protein
MKASSTGVCPVQIGHFVRVNSVSTAGHPSYPYQGGEGIDFDENLSKWYQVFVAWD